MTFSVNLTKPQFPAEFTEKILDGKILCSVMKRILTNILEILLLVSKQKHFAFINNHTVALYQKHKLASVKCEYPLK